MSNKQQEANQLPINGVMAAVDRLIYHSDMHRHSAYVYQESTKMAEIRDWRGNFKAVVAKDLETAVEKLRQQVHSWLSEREAKWHDVILASFEFTVRYEEVRDGLFWQQPSINPITEYSVVIP